MDYRPKGLNGDTVFAAQELSLGKTSGEPYGYKRDLQVTVDIRIERLTRQAEYETVDHRKVSQPLDFAITFSVWRPSRNDITSSGRELPKLTGYGRGLDSKKIKALRELVRWHLNSLTAACAHQEPDAGLDSPPCPETGYQWGRAWLVRELPESFLDDIKAIFANVNRDKIWEDAS
jgi:hypothetical protein